MSLAVIPTHVCGLCSELLFEAMADVLDHAGLSEPAAVDRAEDVAMDGVAVEQGEPRGEQEGRDIGAAAAFAVIGGLGAARVNEVEQLMERQRNLMREKAAVQKEIKKAKQRSKRLMHKAAKNLTDEELMQVIAMKTGAAKAKADARATGARVEAEATANNAPEH